MDYLPARKSPNKELTEMQRSLLDNLHECNYDPIKAAVAAGYKNPQDAVRSVRKELILIAEDMIANNALKAAQTLGSVLDSDKPIMNIKEKIDVAKDILDRSGLAKKNVLDVNVESKGGVFLLPAKKPAEIIEGEFENG